MQKIKVISNSKDEKGFFWDRQADNVAYRGKLFVITWDLLRCIASYEDYMPKVKGLNQEIRKI